MVGLIASSGRTGKLKRSSSDNKLIPKMILMKKMSSVYLYMIQILKRNVPLLPKFLKFCYLRQRRESKETQKKGRDYGNNKKTNMRICSSELIFLHLSSLHYLLFIL